MAQKPVAMEQLKQVLQLRRQNIPIREIARRTGISRNSVKKYLRLINDQADAPTSGPPVDRLYANQDELHQ